MRMRPRLQLPPKRNSGGIENANTRCASKGLYLGMGPRQTILEQNEDEEARIMRDLDREGGIEDMDEDEIDALQQASE